MIATRVASFGRIDYVVRMDNTTHTKGPTTMTTAPAPAQPTFKPNGMDTLYLARFLQACPTYTEVEFVLASHSQPVVGMARDLPTQNDEPRRFTVNGSEWFITRESLDRVGVVEVRVRAMSIDVIGF